MAVRRKRRGADGGQTVNLIVRREETIHVPHHGGAWKVAYADFVTAMMAFFLLMWLISATTVAQRVGLADYFSQANVLNRAASGEGKPFGGRTPFDKGALSSDRGAVRVTVGHNPVSYEVPHVPQGKQVRPDHPTGDDLVNTSPGAGHEPHAFAAALAHPATTSHESGTATIARSLDTPPGSGEIGGLAPGNLGDEAFVAASASIRRKIRNDPKLAALSKQVSIRDTPQGLRIQIMDSSKRPMFALGSARPNRRTLSLLRKITPILASLGDRIRISGYTDARPYEAGHRDNWDLSVDRANATRAVMEQAGLPKKLVAQVSGYADRRLLVPADPYAAANRRVGILVLRPASTEGVKTTGAAVP